MSASGRMTFYSATLTHTSGEELTAALLEPSVVWVGRTTGELAAAFGTTMRKRFLESGQFHQTLPYAQPLELRKVSCTLEIPAAKDGHLFPAHELALDAFTAALPGGGHLGFIPALGAE